MGTHPIFESDFDCLTDMSEGANYYNKSEFGSDFPALRRHVNIMGRYAVSQDPRFLNTNRWRSCWVHYADFYRCTHVREQLGKDTEVCGYFRNNFLQICPEGMIKKFDEQRAAKIFPSPVYSRDIEDSYEWEPKHEAWKVQAEAAKERETKYREFFQSQKELISPTRRSKKSQRKSSRADVQTKFFS